MKEYNDVEGHPNLKQDPDTGAIINVGKGNLKERKSAMRQQKQDMESRIEQLERMVFELYKGKK